MFSRKKNKLNISEQKDVEFIKAENLRLKEQQIIAEDALVELADMLTTAIEEHESALVELAELMEG